MQARPPRVLEDGEMEGDSNDRLIAGGKKRAVLVVEEGSLGQGIMMDDHSVNSELWLKKDRENIPVDEVRNLILLLS